MTWVLYAAGSALFAGITSILAKCGVKRTESNLATAIRTGVVVVFAWLLVLVNGAYKQLPYLSVQTYLFLALSGFSTGASWLCYFKALQLGDVNKVVPIDKSSTVLVMIFAFLFLGENPTSFRLVGAAAVAFGTLLMSVTRGSGQKKGGWSWVLFAVLSAVFAALTSIFGKIGISDVDSNLGTALRTVVVLIMAWFIVSVQYRKTPIRAPKKELSFLVLSGISTGVSWLCYYRALQLGPASAVAAVDKLSVFVTVLFSWIVFRERLTLRSGFGLVLIAVGTILMLF